MENRQKIVTTSYLLFDKYGLENCKIILLENVEAKNIDELKAREAYYIKSIKCVNKRMPLRTNKVYYTENKENIIKRNLKWKEDNKDKIDKKKEENKIKLKQHKIYKKNEYYEIIKKNRKLEKEHKEINKVQIYEDKKIKKYILINSIINELGFTDINDNNKIIYADEFRTNFKNLYNNNIIFTCQKMSKIVKIKYDIPYFIYDDNTSIKSIMGYLNTIFKCYLFGINSTRVRINTIKINVYNIEILQNA